MMEVKREKAPQNRYFEILEDLARLSDWELRSFCLNDSDMNTIQTVLDYKNENYQTVNNSEYDKELVNY